MAGASQRKIIADVNLWMPRIGLHSWHLNVEFLDKSRRGGAVAEIEFSPIIEGYREAKLKIYMPAFNAQTERQRTLDIIHELRHLHYERILAKLESFCGEDTIVTNAVMAEIETLCDKDALYFYKLYSRRKKRTEG